MIWRQHIHKVVPAPGWFRIWKCWSLRRGENRSTRGVLVFPWSLDIFKSEGGLSFMFSILFFFFFILPGTVLSLNWEYIVFQEWWKTLSCFWKVLLKRWSLEYQGVSVVCLARSSHQSLRTYYTICITSPSKEKARTFYLFPFHWCNFF